ncbi:hypothetical protein C5S53_04330 [Methanophagales archaeon]|nr:hypothetical protein C5S53_04330 [Methanophagales archaeon]
MSENKFCGGEKRRKMDKKIVGSVLMAGLMVLSVMVVFTGTAAAELRPYNIIFEGDIMDMSSDGSGVTVEVAGNGYTWCAVTTIGGHYDTGKAVGVGPAGEYVMRLTTGGNTIELDRDIGVQDGPGLGYSPYDPEGFKWVGEPDCYYKCVWDYPSTEEIPEFSTIALPIVSILGLLFFANRRKHRKE